jgi:hypothetical protein
VRRHMIAVTLDLRGDMLHFRYRGSKNMHYEKRMVEWSVLEPYDGEVEFIHSKYLGWTRNFARDIVREVRQGVR